MGSRQLTPQQQQCVDATGGPLLVAAAAGAGKTFVLVQRILRLITDPQSGVDIDRLLVVTFTRAAAAEMRQRLAAELLTRIAADPGDWRLQRQQLLLPRAHVCTVDSFFTALVRDHFYELGLSPQFRLCDAADERILQQETLLAVVEEAYRRAEPAFLELADMLSNGKNDKTLIETIRKVYIFSRSLPFPDRWFAAQRAAYTTPGDIGMTGWSAILTRQAAAMLAYARTLQREMMALAESDEETAAKYGPVLLEDGAMLDRLAAVVETGDWEAKRTALQGVRFGALSPVRGGDPAGIMLRDHIKERRMRMKKLVAKVADDFSASSEECREDIAVTGRQAAALFDLVEAFGKQYDERKRAKGLLDFSDVEHLALKLLLAPGPEGTLVQTPLAVSLSEQFSEILVDEYQDTNGVQDALFCALSRDQQNLFMVGDVKQSIYGFRQARPALFIERRRAYPDYTGNGGPATITLSRNFRSRQTITDSVNYVFRRLMTESTSGFVYDEREALYPGADYPPGEGYETEWLVVDPGDIGRDEAEARAIAARIRKLVGVLPLSDKGGTHPARFSDICILLRSKTARAPLYVRELLAAGVPACTSSGERLLDTPEVAAAVSLLRVIDNPTLDVPLLAVLLSPSFGFSPDDITALRMHCPSGNLYTALTHAAEESDTTPGRFSLSRAQNPHGGLLDAADAARGKTSSSIPPREMSKDLLLRCRAFLEWLAGFRVLAISLPVDELLYRLYATCRLPALMSVRSGGERRQANLMLFRDYARRFEENGYRGLSAFVRRLDRMEQQQLDIDGQEKDDGGDAVRVLSVHQSKGLEYPVVFCAGLSNPMNRESLRGDLIFQADAGVGLRRRDPVTYNKLDTLPHRAVRLAIDQNERAEELRILYVAMTRAREKLFLVTTQKKAAQKWREGGGYPDGLPPAGAILNAGSMGDWLWMIAPPAEEKETAPAEESPAVLSDMVGPLRRTIVSVPAVPETPPAACCVFPPPDEALAEHLQERFSFVYSFAALSAVPSKLAASSLAAAATRRRYPKAFRLSRAQLSAAHIRVSREAVLRRQGRQEPSAGGLIYLSRPAFLSNAGLTSAQKGVAHHTFMQYADFSRAAVALEEEITRLVRQEYLTGPEADALDRQRLRAFFESVLYRRIEAADWFCRELPFTIELPIPEYRRMTGPMAVSPDVSDTGETIVVQGIADGLFCEEGGLVVVDYKTDRVSSAQTLVEAYGQQLRLYAKAFGEMFPLPVKEALLYSFSLGTVIRIDLP